MNAQYGYLVQDFVLYPHGIDVPANESRFIITRDIPVSDNNALWFLMYIDVENVVGTGAKCWLQKLVNEEWVDVGNPQGTVPIDAGDGKYCIMLNTDLEIEAMVLPLTCVVRLTVDTDASSSLRVTRVASYIRV
jgi:hypothetical protein